MIRWLNTKFGTNYTEEDLAEIKNFTLLWSIYENLFFNNNFSIRQLENEIIRRNIRFRDYEEIFEYFRNRYIENGNIGPRFQFLNLRHNDREDFVRLVLLGQIQDDNSKILAIGIIVFRFRNNLFHGLKDVSLLNGQISNFSFANMYLTKFIN
jgi:hypothetical protein